MCGHTQKYILTHKICYKLCPLSSEGKKKKASLPLAEMFKPKAPSEGTLFFAKNLSIF